MLDKLLTWLRNLFDLNRCSVCGKRDYLVDGLCASDWYQKYGKGKHIWETWELLGCKPPKKIQKMVDEIKQMMQN